MPMREGRERGGNALCRSRGGMRGACDGRRFAMLEALGISYAYPGTARLLYEGFDLAVAPDERVALSAPSGFGNTTRCRLLAGF